jgi:type I restriction enzyme M protein
MHDDVFMIMSEGWVGAAKPRKALKDEERKLKEVPDLTIGTGRSASGFKTDLIPPELIVARYFRKEKAKLDELEAGAEVAELAAEEYTEAHAVEEGLLWAAVEDGKMSKSSIGARLKEARAEDADPEEVAALERASALLTEAAKAKKAAKEAKAALDFATLEKYGDLTEDDVKVLVLEDKWKAAVSGRIEAAVTSLVIGIAARLRTLGGRYADTLETLEEEVEKSSGRVADHLTQMGVT